jgi:uncharacterized phage protein (TIGR01671 family)
MNREIKFRIWDKTKKEFHKASRYAIRLDYIRNQIMVDDSYGNYKIIIGQENFVIQQFTGLKDSNGREIYEGDILENIEATKTMGESDDYWERSVVTYYPELARFGLEFYSQYGGEGYTGKEQHISDYVEWGVTVIGNIFENPESLKS